MRDLEPVEQSCFNSVKGAGPKGKFEADFEELKYIGV